MSLPCVYDAKTVKLKLVARLLQGNGSVATWIIKNIPSTMRSQEEQTAVSPTAQFGPIDIEGVAVTDSVDLAGNRGFDTPQHLRREGQFGIEPPSNVDGHKYTGMPATRIIVRSKRTGESSNDWTVYISSAHTVSDTNRLDTSNLSAVRAVIALKQPIGKWFGTDMEIAGGYPGELQQSVQVTGTIEAKGTVSETFNVTGGTIIADPKAGAYMVWSAPHTIRTASGALIVPLNPVGIIDATGSIPVATDPTKLPLAYSSGFITIYVAIKVPDLPRHSNGLNFESSTDNSVFLNAGRPNFDYTRAEEVSWGDVWLPGAPRIPRIPGQVGHRSPSPLRPLMYGNYRVFAVHVMAAGPSIQNSLPLVLNRRFVTEEHPFTLTVAVNSKFPPGWDPTAFDMRVNLPR